MYRLINSQFNRTFNPSGRQNALSDIKRLLTSRDTLAQNKACGYLIEVICKYSNNSSERSQMVEYLLDNDIIVFLFEATSNLEFSLFKTILQCTRLLWRERRFFLEEHAPHAMAAVLRALAHYAGSGLHAAVDTCLGFLCDLLNGVMIHETTPPLSHQSAYSAEQLLACLNALSPRINTNSNSILSSALVLHSLISYQPADLYLRSSTACALVEVLVQWLKLLLGALNHAMLVGNNPECTGMFYVVICQIGMNSLRLTNVLQNKNPKADFVQTILTDDQEIATLEQCSNEITKAVYQVITELVNFTKDNQNQISTEEYETFLKFLLNFLYNRANSEILFEFCDGLFTKGYLTMLPQTQISRNDTKVAKVSTLVLGELLKTLAENYLNFNSDEDNTCARDIHMGLVELQYGIEKPQSLGMQLQKNQSYSLLIYIYFYCQSSDNPQEATAPLLPYLVEHILRLPKSFRPPSYIIKALWLVFAMSTISNVSIKSLDERVYLEKAADRFIAMLRPDPSPYYTHNPAILLWAFTSQRIPNYIRYHVLSQWLKIEDAIPEDLTTEPIVWELLLNILVQCRNDKILENCMKSLYMCLEDGDDQSIEEFSSQVWGLLPGVLSKTLIDFDCEIDASVCYVLDLATNLLPSQLDQTICLKVAVLVTALFSKSFPEQSMDNLSSKYYFEYACLKLTLYLIGLSFNQKDNRVLLTFMNRPSFLPNVLLATNSLDNKVACSALQLLSYIIHYYTKNKSQPKSVLQMQTNLIIKSLREDSSNERGASLLQLVYMILNSGVSTPLVLSHDIGLDPSESQQCNALRALMFRIQMLCCKESKTQSSAGWKTLSSIFKHAIISKNDPKLVATLTSQPWTHTLIQFQLTQTITEEFLAFTQNWLTLVKITQKKEGKMMPLSKYSLMAKTLMVTKKNLVLEEDLKESKEKVLKVVEEILDETGSSF